MEDSTVYRKSPSIASMERDKSYKNTLKNYRQILMKEMMIYPENLQDFAAPVLCPFCEVPVITQAKSARTTGQSIDLALCSVFTLGMGTYDQKTKNKNVDHTCPACQGLIATRVPELKGHFHTTHVHASYNGLHNGGSSQGDSSGQGASGINASGFQISGYNSVRFGNNYYIVASDSKTAVYGEKQ